MAKYIMALDQGTTSSRCILFDHNAQMVSVAQKEYRQIFPQPGYVEHDPNDIWASQLSVAMEAMAQAGIRVNEIAAIGITNQRETTIVWDKATGKPVYNAIVWQCRRTADRVSRIYEDGFDKTLTEKTGLIPDPYFSATKLEWSNGENALNTSSYCVSKWNRKRFFINMEDKEGAQHLHVCV